MENNFRNYKEKQNYYRNRAKQTTTIFVSKEPDFGDKKNTIIKGRTYVKPKDNKNEE